MLFQHSVIAAMNYVIELHTYNCSSDLDWSSLCIEPVELANRAGDREMCCFELVGKLSLRLP